MPGESLLFPDNEQLEMNWPIAHGQHSVEDTRVNEVLDRMDTEIATAEALREYIALRHPSVEAIEDEPESPDAQGQWARMYAFITWPSRLALRQTARVVGVGAELTRQASRAQIELGRRTLRMVDDKELVAHHKDQAAKLELEAIEKDVNRKSDDLELLTYNSFVFLRLKGLWDGKDDFPATARQKLSEYLSGHTVQPENITTVINWLGDKNRRSLKRTQTVTPPV